MAGWREFASAGAVRLDGGGKEKGGRERIAPTKGDTDVI
jgi:hypothetical protein